MRECQVSLCLHAALRIRAAVCFETQAHAFDKAVVVVSLALEDGLVLALRATGVLLRVHLVDETFDFWACVHRRRTAQHSTRAVQHTQASHRVRGVASFFRQ